MWLTTLKIVRMCFHFPIYVIRLCKNVFEGVNDMIKMYFVFVLPLVKSFRQQYTNQCHSQ